MNIQINDITIKFPASLADITLGQRIAFEELYGERLESMLKAVFEMEDGMMKDLALQDFHDESAMCFFAFFANCDLETVKQDSPADQVLSLYNSVFAQMLADEQEIKSEQEFEWNGELWRVQSPILSNSNTMKFGEFLDAKQIMKDLVDDKGSRWHFLLKVCCIFLRKADEAYNISMIDPEGERIKLMQDLPIDIALRVGFFLTSSIDLFRNTSAFFRKDVADQDTTSLNTSTSGDGFTSSNP